MGQQRLSEKLIIMGAIWWEQGGVKPKEIWWPDIVRNLSWEIVIYEDEGVKWEANYDGSEVAWSLIFLVFHCHQLKEVWWQCTYFTRNSEEPILRNPNDGYEEKRQNGRKTNWEFNYEESKVAWSLRNYEVWWQCTYFTGYGEEPKWWLWRERLIGNSIMKRARWREQLSLSFSTMPFSGNWGHIWKKISTLFL